MLIVRESLLTGIIREMNLDISIEQVIAHANGANIQDVMKNITEDQREFYLTGIVSEEWDRAFLNDEPPD
jgi:hypothetical protein